MTAPVELLELMREKEQRPAAVLDQLKRHYDLSDAQIGAAVGMRHSEIQIRRAGKRGFTPALIAGLAAFFGLPEQVFYMTPTEAVRIAIERDPQQEAPQRWLVLVDDDSDRAREAPPSSACFTAAEKAAARRRHPTSSGMPARAARAA